MSALARAIATWFGCGYVPKAPGTAGTLGGLAVALAFYRVVPSPWWWAAIAAAAFAPAVWAAGVVARDEGLADPQIVVVDEVIGIWIAGAGAAHYSWRAWLAAFVLFRVFDIWKPWPARQLERVPGGLGIVLDDVMAGVYSALVLWAGGWFNSISVFLYGSA